jgi:hypothetical protein
MEKSSTASRRPKSSSSNDDNTTTPYGPIHLWAIDRQLLKPDHQNQFNYTNHPLCSKLKILSHQVDQNIGQVTPLSQLTNAAARKTHTPSLDTFLFIM